MAQAKRSVDYHKNVNVPGYLSVSRIIAYIVYAWAFIAVVLLALRVFLLAFSANASTPFVEFVYRTSADYMAPFRDIFPVKPVGETGYFDVAALFAIIMYLLLAWLISSVIHLIQHKIDQETA
ncbi:YggT family protein [Candidatus Saccharibacteria bacterium]|nr:YggT family protein [Candidatus Saccharibacteria bacterium]